LSIHIDRGNEMNIKAIMKTQIFALLTILLVSCGGGGSSSVTPETATRSGYAVDDYVIGGKVSIVSLSSGAVLYETTTGEKGAFQWPQSLSGAVRVEITGGNEDYDGIASTTSDQKPFEGKITALLYAEKQEAPLIVSAVTTGLSNAAGGDITKYEAAKSDLPSDISKQFFTSASDSQSDIGDKLEVVKKVQRAMGFNSIVSEVSDDGKLNNTAGLSSSSLSAPISVASTNSALSSIQDISLQMCIASTLDKDIKNITASDLRSLTELYCSDAGIRSLAGIEAASNLESLQVDGNEITNVAPVTALSKLYFLNIENNNVSSLSSLSQGSYSALSISANKNCITDAAQLQDNQKIRFTSGSSAKQFPNCQKNDADVQRLKARISGTGAYVVTYITTQNSLANCQIDWGDGSIEQALCDARSHIVQHAYSAPPTNPVKFLINGAVKAQASFPSTSYNININPIAFQQVSNNSASYSTGLVFWVPRSSSGTYDTATVQGLGTETQTNGVVNLKDTGSGTSLSVMQASGSYGGDVFGLPNSLAVNAIPAGTAYTVKLYKGTALVSTQTVRIADAVIAPSAMSAAMFPALALNTYEQLCPNGSATTAQWYSIPSNLPNSPQYSLSCAGSSASGRVEAGDSSNRRFDTEFSISAASSSLNVVASQEYNSATRTWVATNVSTSAFISGYQNDNMSDIFIDTGALNLSGRSIRFDVTSQICKMDLKVNTSEGAFVFYGNEIKVFPASWTPSALSTGSYALAFQTASANSMNWSLSKDGGQVTSGVVATAGNVIRGTINPSSGGTYQQTVEVYMYDKNFIGGSSGCGIRNFAIQ
jgi:hypothetical protein